MVGVTMSRLSLLVLVGAEQVQSGNTSQHPSANVVGSMDVDGYIGQQETYLTIYSVYCFRPVLFQDVVLDHTDIVANNSCEV